MSKFLDLLERSVIVQSLLPLLFGGCSCALWLQGKYVDDSLLNLTYICVAFWMGAKMQHTVDTRRQGQGRD